MAEHISPDPPPSSSPFPRPPPPTVQGPAGEILRMARQKGAWEKELLSRWQSEDRDWRAAQRTRIDRMKEIEVQVGLTPDPDEQELLLREKAVLVEGKKVADASQATLRERRAAQLAALQLTAEERRVLRGPVNPSPRALRSTGHR
eukprot:TRINITY_DN3860_c0_g1_i1.p1 TRINITY_DN3860_c0_g1~~TRINITY_DN3860_c0_g1_i1.p1  ORF type:complete len:146 (+),score=43.38 TRINITY_DN3860_c0_g1_i1:100-537(+)